MIRGATVLDFDGPCFIEAHEVTRKTEDKQRLRDYEAWKSLLARLNLEV